MEESFRLRTLESLALRDTASDPAFDDLTALTADALGLPMAWIGLVDAHRVWWKSQHGVPLCEAAREHSFSANAMLDDGVLEYSDVSTLPLARRLMVDGEAPGSRFLAGVALRHVDGTRLGALCVADHEPRQLDERQRRVLARLARQAERLIELHAARLAQTKASSEFRHLALAVRHTDNVVVIADAQGLATWVNPAFERVTGYRAEDVIGHTPGHLLQFPGSSELARAELREAVRSRQPCQVQILNRAKSGRTYWMNVDLQPLYGDRGEFEGFVSVETDITGLIRQREHARALLDVLPVGVLLQSRQAEILDANPAAHEILGMARGTLPGRNTRAVHWLTVDENDQPLPDDQRPLAQVLATGEATEPRRIGIRNGMGEQRWLDLRCVPLRGPDGEVEAALTCFNDITAAVRTDGMLKTAMGAADLGSWTWEPEEDRWWVSPNWSERFGPLQNNGRWLERVHGDDIPQAQAAMFALLRGEQATYRAEFRLRMGDGQWRWLLSYAAVAERSVHGRVLRVSGVLMDIDERRRAEERLRVAATTDALTGLPNRSLLADRLGQAQASCQRRRRLGALIYLDLDHFKRINDSHGHAAGDALLCELTRRLREALRIEDTLARMGGDELMVLLPDVGASATEAEAAAREVARKLRATLEVPVQVGALEYRVGASIGITVFPREDSPTVEDLIREADTAMYVAKQAERGSVRLYESTMREHVASRVALERALRLAIEQDQIRLHLQGQWTADGQMAGIEALARWQDPELGAVSPVDFIPVAEESGLILPLGRRVVEQACATARRLHDEGILVPLSVNVSPRQFTDPGFVAHLLQSVRDQGIAPSDLQLELTEGILADDASERLMNRLADEGFRFSIDDFGTGWSNLMYLKRLPVHELKIDRAFVR
ncbi:MAG: EAL domain-containing protein, partial [Rhodoferax sp.]|nr:EAL domain-containing protein [Rhodoferax sp.]